MNQISEEPSTIMKATNFDELINKHRTNCREITKCKILVVEDDQVNQLIIEFYLKSIENKVQFVKAYNGAEAIKIIKEKANGHDHFNIILMDCDMPVMNGLEATRIIKKMEKEKEILPLKVIAFTANVSVGDRNECYKYGMDDVWTKPLSKAEFLDKLIKYIA